MSDMTPHDSNQVKGQLEFYFVETNSLLTNLRLFNYFIVVLSSVENSALKITRYTNSLLKQCLLGE